MTDLNFGRGPIDPAYTAFSSGLATAVAEWEKPWRWRPKDKKWYVYVASEWLFEDAGLGATPAGNALRSEMDDNMKLHYEVGASSDVEDLFTRLAAKASEISSKDPKLDAVWNPQGGGAWRAVHRRGVAPGPGPKPGVLPQSASDRIAKVEALVAADKLRPDAGRELMDAIIAEYT